MTTVIGLDLSLNGSAATALSPQWRPGDWVTSAIRSRTFKPEKGVDGAKRLAMVSEAIVRWVLGNVTAASYTTPRILPLVYVEDYAFAATVTNARAVAELVGCVKRDLWRDGIEVTPVAMNSARKTLLGKVPTKKKSGIAVKDHVNHQLALMGARFATMDEGDAFVVANHARSLLGLPFVGVDSEKAGAEVFGG